MTNQDFINNIINSMIGYLNPNQINLLQATLTKELYDYEISKKCTELSIQQDDIDFINDAFLRKYEIEKRVQGMSERTIYQYINTTRNFLYTLRKDFRNITKDDVTYYLALLIKQQNMSNVTLDNIRCIK